MDFVAGISFLVLVGKECPEKSQENPRQNPPKFIHQKYPTHIRRGAGANIFVPPEPNPCGEINCDFCDFGVLEPKFTICPFRLPNQPSLIIKITCFGIGAYFCNLKSPNLVDFLVLEILVPLCSKKRDFGSCCRQEISS